MSGSRWTRIPLLVLLVLPLAAGCLTPPDFDPPLAPLPEVEHPADNPYTAEKVELGRWLFFDPRLSGDGSTSCASCHPPDGGAWTLEQPISIGYPGTTHWRNAQTIINSAYYDQLNWDGSAKSLEQQAKKAWTSAIAGNIDPAMAEERLAQVPDYVERFETVFGTPYPRFIDAVDAVAAYERTVVSNPAPADRFFAGHEDALSPAERRGHALFSGQARCIRCHNGPLVSDGQFYNLGVPPAPDFQTAPLRQITVRWELLTKGATEDEYRTLSTDLGLYHTTKVERDRGRFRTPSLRDVCYTAPYMHNGVFETLDEVVAFYIAGGGDDPNKDPLVRPLDLDAGQADDLVAFLRALCGEPVTAEAPTLPDYAAWSAPDEEGDTP